MEPGTVASVSGLLLQYLSGQQQDEIKDATDFLEYLSRHQHKELRHTLEENDKAMLGLKSLLKNRTDEILERLTQLAELQVTLASRMPELQGITAAFAPSIALSDEAYQIIKDMDEQKLDFILVTSSMGSGYSLVGVEYKGDTRFLHDDLATLTRFGLLIEDYNDNGNPLYRFTREALNLIQQVEEDSQESIGK